MSPERIRPGSAARIRPGSATRREATEAPEPAEVSEEIEALDAAEVSEQTEAAETEAAETEAAETEAAETEAAETEAARPLGEARPSKEAPGAIGEGTTLEEAPGTGSGVLEARPAPARPRPPRQRPSRRNGAGEAPTGDEAAAGAGDEPAPAGDEAEPASTGSASSDAPRRHGRFARLYYGQTRIEFVRRRRWWFAFSTIVILAGVISLGTRGLNLGIDFVGGTAWTVQSKTFTIAEARQAVAPFGMSTATITVLGASSSNRTVEIQARLASGQSSARTPKEASTVAGALAKAADVHQEAVSIATVGPSWGSEITNKAIVALIVFFILIALYISIFFEWRMALAAITAVVHDILVTVGIYSLTGFEVTPDTVVAFLTILGYSLYDTIVVFDRVRDNTKRLGMSGKLTFSDLVNLSMNQTLARSINTSLVAILPILSVLVLGAYVLGATTLEYFGLALLIGLATGAYSSIFIASPLVAVLKEREPRYRNIRERLAQRGSDTVLLSAADVAAGLLGQELEAGGGPTPRARERAQRRRQQQARPKAGGSAAARRPSPARRKGGRR